MQKRKLNEDKENRKSNASSKKQKIPSKESSLSEPMDSQHLCDKSIHDELMEQSHTTNESNSSTKLLNNYALKNLSLNISSCLSGLEEHSVEFKNTEKIQALDVCLKNFKILDKWIEGEANELPSLNGLNIDKFGPVRFPFGGEQADSLIEMCEKKLHTTKNENVDASDQRTSYQIDPNEFMFKNPIWKDSLEKLVSRITLNFGYKAEADYKLEKFLVLKKGN